MLACLIKEQKGKGALTNKPAKKILEKEKLISFEFMISSCFLSCTVFIFLFSFQDAWCFLY